MNDYLDIRQAAKLMGISEKSVRKLCQSGKLTGAIKEKNIWKIPRTSIEKLQQPEEKKSWIAKILDKTDNSRIIQKMSSFIKWLQDNNSPTIKVIVAIGGALIFLIGISASLAGNFADWGIASMIPTPLAGPTAVVGGEDREILVLLATFDQMSGNPLEPQREWKVTLDEAINQLQGKISVRVQEIPLVVTTHEEARKLSNQYQATLVIWGRARANTLESYYTISPRWSPLTDDLKGTILQGSLEEQSQFVSLGGDSEYVLYYVLSQLTYFDKNFDDALIYIDNAISLVSDERKGDMGIAVLYLYKGSILSDKSLYEEAIKYINMAIDIDGESTRAYGIRALAYYNQGKFEFALQDFDKAISINAQDISLYSNRGIVLSDMGNYNAALMDYDTAIKLEPDNAFLYVNRGTVLVGMGRYTEAINDFRNAIQLDHILVNAYYNIGLVENTLGNYEESISNYSIAIELQPEEHKIYLNRALSYISLRKNLEAIQDLNKSIELAPAPDSFLAHNNRGLLYMQLGNYNKAREDFDRSIELNPYSTLPLFNRGLLFNMLGEYQKAIEDFSQAIDLDQNFALAYFHRARAYIKLGDMEKSREDFAKVFDLDPSIMTQSSPNISTIPQ